MTLSFKSTGARLALVAFMLAAGGQYLFSALDARPRGRLLYMSAMLVMLIATYWLDGRIGERTDQRQSSVEDEQQAGANLVIVALAAVLAVVAGVLVYQGELGPWALIAWIGSIAALLASTPRASGWPDLANPRLFLFVFAFTVVAVLLRLPMLETLPPDVHIDEATMALESRKILDGEMTPLLTLGWDQYPSFGFAIHSATMALAGDSLFGFRLASVIGGLITIGLTVLLGRLLFGAFIGVVAGYLMVVSHWHIHLSRMGLHYMDAMVTSLAAVFFLVLGVIRGSQRAFAVSGIALGLCFYVYYTARLSVLLAVGIIVLGVLHRRASLGWWSRRIGWMALGGAITLLPLLVVYARAPEAALARSDRVSIFSQRNFEFVENSQRIQGVPAVLSYQAQRSIEMFNIAWDSSGQFGSRDPLLDAVSGVPFVIGLVLAVRRIRNFGVSLLVGWLALALIGVTVTNGVPFSPRATIALPAIMLLAAIGVAALRAALIGALMRAPAVRWNVAIAGLMAVIAAFNIWGYFGRYVVDTRPAGVATTVGRVLTSGEAIGSVTLIGGPELERTIDIVRFLAPDARYTSRFAQPYSLDPQSGAASVLIDSRTPDQETVVSDVQKSLSKPDVTEHRDHQGRLVLTVVRSSGQ